MSFTDEPSTIAVVQIGRLGDMILTTPLAEALAERFPSARITMISSAVASPIARHAPSVDDVFEVGRGAVGLAGAVVRLGMRSFDLYVDPKDHRSSTSRMLARSTRARRVIAHPSNAPSEFLALPPTAEPGHYVDRMLAPMRLLAPDATPARRPRIGIPSDAAVAAARVRAQVGDEYAVINISAGAAMRYWSVDGTIGLAQWLAERLPVVVVSTPADRRTAHSVATTAANIVAADTSTMLELAAIVAGARLLVSPDTSVIHVASAYDVLTLGLYPDNPPNLRLFAPLATQSEVVIAPSDGTVADIALDDVTAAAGRLLERIPAPGAAAGA